VTLAKMANLAANSVIGNNTGSPATPIALTQAQLTAMINNFTSSLAGDVPASGGGTTNFLRADGSWTAPPSTTITPTADIRTASATITIPTNATKLLVTLVGGGGGGAGEGNQAVCTENGGGPGGSAAALVKYLSGLTPGNTLALTIGAAGSGGAAGANNGGNGGDTTLASGTQTITTLTAGKGSGGLSAAGTGAGGTATNGDLNIPGGSSGVLVSGPTLMGIVGEAGLGLAPTQVYLVTSATVNGAAGKGFGGGGQGGAVVGAATASGGNGAAGCAIFQWFA
jgi:hypothetical protein